MVSAGCEGDTLLTIPCRVSLAVATIPEGLTAVVARALATEHRSWLARSR
jgi:hypothetical protein